MTIYLHRNSWLPQFSECTRNGDLAINRALAEASGRGSAYNDA